MNRVPWTRTEFDGDFGRFDAVYPATLKCLEKFGHKVRTTESLLKDALLLQHLLKLHEHHYQETDQDGLQWMPVSPLYLSRMSGPNIPLHSTGTVTTQELGCDVDARIPRTSAFYALRRFTELGIIYRVSLNNTRDYNGLTPVPRVALNPAAIKMLKETVTECHNPLEHVISRIFMPYMGFEEATAMSAWHYNACLCSLLHHKGYHNPDMFTARKRTIWMPARIFGVNKSYRHSNVFMPPFTARYRAGRLTRTLVEKGWLKTTEFEDEKFVTLSDKALDLLEKASEAVRENLGKYDQSRISFQGAQRKSLLKKDPSPFFWYAVPTADVRKAIRWAASEIMENGTAFFSTRCESGKIQCVTSKLFTISLYSSIVNSLSMKNRLCILQSRRQMYCRQFTGDTSCKDTYKDLLHETAEKHMKQIENKVQAHRDSVAEQVKETRNRLAGEYRDMTLCKNTELKRDRNKLLNTLYTAHVNKMSPDETLVHLDNNALLEQILRVRQYYKMKPWYPGGYRQFSAVNRASFTKFRLPLVSVQKLEELIDKAVTSACDNSVGMTEHALLQSISERLYYILLDETGSSAEWLISRIYKKLFLDICRISGLGGAILDTLTHKQTNRKAEQIITGYRYKYRWVTYRDERPSKVHKKDGMEAMFDELYSKAHTMFNKTFLKKRTGACMKAVDNVDINQHAAALIVAGKQELKTAV